MPVDHIRYDILAQEALRGVLRGVLADVAKKGLPGEHHFYITFDTTADGVRLSPRLHSDHPQEMTVILQHQFWDLTVSEDRFEVGLSFNGIPERITVPFAAVKVFLDPSVQFALQFEQVPAEAAEAEAAAEADEPQPPLSAQQPQRSTAAAKERLVRTTPAIPPPGRAPEAPAAISANQGEPDKPAPAGGEVVRLDRFRKK
jgi:hypothetical protein